MSERIDKYLYYLKIAEAVALRGTCLRRNSGAVIVKNDKIVSTGYTGSPRGMSNCCDTGFCIRNETNCKPGENYSLCPSIHAEENAIIHAGRDAMIGATMYLATICYDAETHYPYNGTFICDKCKGRIINSGIERVYLNKPRTWAYWQDRYPEYYTIEEIKQQLKESQELEIKLIGNIPNEQKNTK